MAADVQIVFWGHACFGIHRGSNAVLLIDPFDPEGLGTTPGPPAIPTQYPYVIATHEHSDHAAFHTQPNAQRVYPDFSDAARNLHIDARTAAHDEFGGRLRGGTTHLLDVQIAGLRIVHCGDLGERPVGDLLAWIQHPTPDLLIVPAGGYFTLGADGASELANAVQPRHVIFCHTRDDGLPLPQLSTRAVISERVKSWDSRHLATLPLSKATGPRDASGPMVIWLERPDGKPLIPQ